MRGWRTEPRERFGDLHWQPNCANCRCHCRLLFGLKTAASHMLHMPNAARRPFAFQAIIGNEKFD